MENCSSHRSDVLVVNINSFVTVLLHSRLQMFVDQCSIDCKYYEYEIKICFVSRHSCILYEIRLFCLNWVFPILIFLIYLHFSLKHHENKILLKYHLTFSFLYDFSVVSMSLFRTDWKIVYNNLTLRFLPILGFYAVGFFFVPKCWFLLKW